MNFADFTDDFNLGVARIEDRYEYPEQWMPVFEEKDNKIYIWIAGPNHFIIEADDEMDQSHSEFKVDVSKVSVEFIRSVVKMVIAGYRKKGKHNEFAGIKLQEGKVKINKRDHKLINKYLSVMSQREPEPELGLGI